jgi:hypothetical protein
MTVGVDARRTTSIGSVPRSVARPSAQPMAPVRGRSREADGPRSRTRVTGPEVSG